MGRTACAAQTGDQSPLLLTHAGPARRCPVSLLFGLAEDAGTNLLLLRRHTAAGVLCSEQTVAEAPDVGVAYKAWPWCLAPTRRCATETAVVFIRAVCEPEWDESPRVLALIESELLRHTLVVRAQESTRLEAPCAARA